MNLKLNSSTKHALNAFLSDLEDPELNDACLSFAQPSEAKASKDWEDSLQMLKRLLKNTPFSVSNVNKLKEKPHQELSDLLSKVVKNEKFYCHTIQILKVWLLTRKLSTVVTFLDAMDLPHSGGMLNENETAPGHQDLLKGIQAIQTSGNPRDNALYLNFILYVWAAFKKDNFWAHLKAAVNDSGIELDLNNLPLEQSAKPIPPETKEPFITTNKKKDEDMTEDTQHSYYQRILFGSPGTGKSHKIDNEMLVTLGIKEQTDGHCRFVKGRDADLIKTVFHPEYTYGDFIGKLLPITKEGKVEYRFCLGHFLKALGKAYKNIIEANKEGTDPKAVVLVIDEINRANSSAVFGTAFQLLDRNDDGWSSYSVTLSELEIEKLFEDLGIIRSKENSSNKYRMPGVNSDPVLYETFCEKLCEKLNQPLFSNREIKIPPNLSIIGSMNTSDNSIYFMDSAFKRRWQWEFVDWDDESVIPESSYSPGLNEVQWKQLVRNLNTYLKSKHEYIRGIEDKQIGHYFIKDWKNGGAISAQLIRNKLMFFVWDSVFQRDKKPLLELINSECTEESQLKKCDLVTFGDFCRHHNEFVNALLNRS